MTQRPIVFMWENFGPMHVDRCAAVRAAYGGRRRVIGIELGGRSDTYAWSQSDASTFEKYTLFPDTSTSTVPSFYRFIVLLKICLSFGKSDFFFCHYEQFVTAAVATLLRFCGRHVFIMNDLKFDDKPRRLVREFASRCFSRHIQARLCPAGGRPNIWNSWVFRQRTLHAVMTQFQ